MLQHTQQMYLPLQRMTAKVMIQKDKEKSLLASYIKSLYHRDTSQTNCANDNSYRYAVGNPNN